jgi:hypothetical protein
MARIRIPAQEQNLVPLALATWIRAYSELEEQREEIMLLLRNTIPTLFNRAGRDVCHQLLMGDLPYTVHKGSIAFEYRS